MTFARLTIGLALLSTRTSAQEPPRPPTITYVIKSAKLREPRKIYVVPPRGNTERAGVLVLLDADDGAQFAAAIANVDFLTDRGAVPPLIIVGIPNTNRTYDLTPRATGTTARQFPVMGNAKLMAQFIIDEALPFVRGKYATFPTSVLAGHSFGGLFVLHVAATRPDAFAGIIAMSPSLWWNDGKAAEAYADSIATSKSPLRLMATSGGLEFGIDTATMRFAARLQQRKAATVAFARQRYPNDTHGLTPEPSLVDGLRFIFAPLSLDAAPILTIRTRDSASIMRGFVATQQTYARGARDLKLPEVLPESFVNRMGYAVLTELKRPSVALLLFRQNAANYPDSPNVYDGVGDALLAAGDRREARTQFQRAIDVAMKTKVPVDTATQRKLKALDKTLGAGSSRPK